MILDRKHALDDQIIHLTEDNMKSLQQEVSDVRGALLEKFPDQEFKRILPKLNPDQIIPKDALFQIELGPNPDSNIYGAYGWTIRADCVPYSFLLAKWIGIQVDVETPFIEELLLWIRKMNSQEDVPCRNSQWRHEYFQKRRLMLKKKTEKVATERNYGLDSDLRTFSKWDSCTGNWVLFLLYSPVSAQVVKRRGLSTIMLTINNPTCSWEVKGASTQALFRITK